MANIALIGWPVVAIILFSTLPLRNALIWSVLLAYLFLPEAVGFDFQGLPALNKTSIPALALLFCVLAFGQRTAGRIGMPGSSEMRIDRGGIIKGLLWVLTLGLLVAPVLTVLDNLDATRNGGRFLPGLQLWDIINIVFANATFVLPYFLARRYLSTPEAHKILLRALVMIGLAYSFLVLVEVRLSPQLNMWVYGYYQHSFAQHIREGGFRPMVFLKHGLWVGFFLFSVILAAVALYRGRKAEADSRLARKCLLVGVWMFAVLLLSQNLGATALAFCFAPTILFLGSRWQVRIAAMTAIVFLAYPAVRQADLVPTDRITSMAANISEDRASSFQFRLDNEDILLDRALQKPLVGWGGWGRARVYDEAGRDVSTTDGIWIIILGDYGWIGYMAFFGFLTFPVIVLWRMSRHREIPYETAGLAVIMAGNFIYMIPNSTLSPIGWLMAGALAGYVQFEPVRSKAPETPATGHAPREARYTRFRGEGMHRPVARRSRNA